MFSGGSTRTAMQIAAIFLLCIYLTNVNGATIPPPVTYPPVTGDDIPSQCMTNYKNAFQASFRNIVSRMNSDINAGRICIGSSDLTLSAGNINTILYSPPQTIDMDFTMMVLPPSGSPTSTMEGIESCTWESTAYLENFDNWSKPIIPTPPGCPPIDFIPPTFGVPKPAWVCDS